MRLWVLFQLTDSPFFSQDHGDSGYYLRWAARIARGTWSDGQAFLGLPFYPYLLGLMQACQLPFPWTPLLLQALADATTSGCLGLAIASTALRPEARSTIVGALLGAAGWAFYGPAQAFAATVMPNTLATLVFAGVLTYLLRRRGGLSTAAVGGLGLGVGAAAMLSANLLFLLPLIAVAAWPREPQALPQRVPGILLRTVLLTLGLAVGSSPSWLHNYLIAREPVALSAHSGINFYIGNNPLATGYPNFPPGIRASQEGLLEDSARLAEASVGRPLRRFEVSAYWNAQAGKFISESPFAWLRIIFAKVRNYYSIYEYDDISILRPLRTMAITTPGWNFGWVCVAAAIGLILGFGLQPATRWAAAAVLLQTLSVLPAFVTERYRLMAVPALLLVAGTGGLAAWQNRSAPGQFRVWAGALLAGGLAVWVVHSAPRPGGVELLADYNTAVRLLAAGLREEAVPMVEKIEASNATNAEVALMLGNFWQEAGDARRALGHYREAIQRDPTLLRAWNNAAVLAIQEKNWPLAEMLVAHLRQAAPPNDSRVHYYVARVALAKGDPAAARQAVETALRLRPGETLYLELQEEIGRNTGSR